MDGVGLGGQARGEQDGGGNLSRARRRPASKQAEQLKFIALDAEDQRISQLTEKLLYHFLPSALNVVLPHVEDPLKELDADRCRAVAGAALCVAALMNAPPGFLEFLLCVPWRKLSQLYPKSDSIDKLISNLHVTDEERKRLVNMRLQPALMRTVLEFLYRPEHADSVPPMLRLTQTAGSTGSSSWQQGRTGPEAPALDDLDQPEPPKVVTLETVAALLDGATPLHCAALRGNPSQVEHLLSSGANPATRTTAGELPIEMVPVCSGTDSSSSGSSSGGQHDSGACRCMGAAEQDVWECRSRLARSLIARRCVMSLTMLGLWSWLHVILLCLLCCLGQWGNHASICRPAVERHMAVRKEQRHQEAKTRAQVLLLRMRTEAKQGRAYLAAAKQEASLGPASKGRAGSGHSSSSTTASRSNSAGVDSIPTPSHKSAMSAHTPDGLGHSAEPGPPSESTVSSTTVSHHPPHGEHPLGALTAFIHNHASNTHDPVSPSQAHTHTNGTANGDPVSALANKSVNNASTTPGVLPAVPAGGGLAVHGHLPEAVQGILIDLSISSAARAPALAGAPASIHDISAHLKESEALTVNGEEQASERAFKCFVRAVHALQSLDLQGETVPQVLSEEVQSDQSETSSSTHVLEDEQADLYCGWAESVLLKFSRTCTCPGCAALAVQAVRMAHLQACRLYARAEQRKGVTPEQLSAVVQAFARIVYVHICLLLETDAQASATRASVWRADMCLREWERLLATGLVGHVGQPELAKVEALQSWARTADSDLYIAEALLGTHLGNNQSLQDVLSVTVGHTETGLPYLIKGVNQEVVTQLDDSITLAVSPSPSVSALARALSQSCKDELAAGQRLHDIIHGSRMPSGGCTAETLAGLMAAIAAAEPFPRLRGELATCRALQEKWMRRADAVEKLEAVVEDVKLFSTRHPLTAAAVGSAESGSNSSGAGGSGSGGGAALADSQSSRGNRAANSANSSGSGNKGPGGQGKSQQQQSGDTGVSGSGGISAAVQGSEAGGLADLSSAWEQQLQLLEAAIAEAKEANISVNKAKRLLKEMQAQSAAAEATRQLEVVMAKRPAGAGTVKAALSKAEAAASNLSSLGGASLAEALIPRIQAARKRLEAEKAAEALYKASQSCKGVSDLPKLEAAILNARKVGAEELDPDVYKSASEMRARLSDAARARSALDSAQKALSKGQREEDADALEKAIQEVHQWSELIGPELSRAREALESWRSQSVTEGKLTRALRDGTTSTHLARLVQEASAAGVKVADAKRVLKLLQAVETAVNGIGSSPGGASIGGADGAAAQLALLKSRIEAAESGGVTSSFPIMTAAARALRRLSAAAAREGLEAALKPHSDWSALQRISALHAALEQAEEVVGAAAIASVCASSSSSGGAEKSGTASESAASGSSKSQQQHRPGSVRNRGNSGSGKGSAGHSGSGAADGSSAAGSAGDGAQGTKGAASPTSLSRCSSLASSFVGAAETASGRSSPVRRTGSGPRGAGGKGGSGGGAADAKASRKHTITDGVSAGAGDGPVLLTTISDDDADLAMVLELARRARLMLDEDEREAARLEAERAAAERERRERQERERAERARLEQERQQREKAEAAERERAAAEKREKARAERQQGGGGKGHSSKGVKLDLSTLASTTSSASTGTASTSGNAWVAGSASITGGANQGKHNAKAQNALGGHNQANRKGAANAAAPAAGNGLAYGQGMGVMGAIVPPPPPPPPRNTNARKDYKQAAESGAVRSGANTGAAAKVLADASAVVGADYSSETGGHTSRPQRHSFDGSSAAPSENGHGHPQTLHHHGASAGAAFPGSGTSTAGTTAGYMQSTAGFTHPAPGSTASAVYDRQGLTAVAGAAAAALAASRHSGSQKPLPDLTPISPSSLLFGASQQPPQGALPATLDSNATSSAGGGAGSSGLAALLPLHAAAAAAQASSLAAATRGSVTGLSSSGGGGADGLGNPSLGNTGRSSHHARGDSLDVMGDASAKLNRDMLEALDLAEDLDSVLLKGSSQAGAGGRADDEAANQRHSLRSHSAGAAGQVAEGTQASTGASQPPSAGASTQSLLAAGAQELAALHQQRTGNGLLSRVPSLALARQQSMAEQGPGVPGTAPGASSGTSALNQPVTASIVSSVDGTAPPPLAGSSTAASSTAFVNGGTLTAIPMPPAPLLLGQGGTWAFSPSGGGSTTSLAVDPAVEAAWATPVPGAATSQGATGAAGTGAAGIFSTAGSTSGRSVLGAAPQLLIMSQPSQVPSSVFSSATSTEEAVTAHFAAQQQQQAAAALGASAADGNNASPLNDAFGTKAPGGFRYSIRDLGGMSWGLDGGQQAAAGNGAALGTLNTAAGAGGLNSRRAPPPGFGGLPSTSAAGVAAPAGHSLSVLSLLHAPGPDGEAVQMMAELAEWDKPGAGFGSTGMAAFGTGGPVTTSVLAFGAPGTSAFGGGSTTGSGLATPSGTISDGWALLGQQGAPRTLTGLAAHHHSASQLGAAGRNSTGAVRPTSQPLQQQPAPPQLPDDIFSVSPSK